MSDSTPVLASPPADCCLSGFVHAGQPVGEMVSVGGIATYLTKPPNFATENTERILFYFPDVWGIEGSFQSNGKLLMDYFATQGLI